MNNTVMALTEHKLAVEILKLLENTFVDIHDCVIQVFSLPSQIDKPTKTYTCLYFPPNNKSFVRVDLPVSADLIQDEIMQQCALDISNAIINEMKKGLTK